MATELPCRPFTSCRCITAVLKCGSSISSATGSILRNDGVADGDHLPGQADNTDGSDPYGVAYGGGRADIRWALGTDNELYLISKSDGMIRQLLNFGDYTGVAGDFNFDGQLNNADLQAMLAALQSSNGFKSTHNLADADWLALGDFNHDSVVNLADLSP